MEKIILSAFADEASSSVSGQIKAMTANGVSMLEARGIDGKNISDFKIKFWEVRKYANTFEIEVPKDQESLQQNLINDVLVYDESMGNISTALDNHKNIMFKNSCVSSSNTITDDNIVESENHNLLILDVSKVAVYRLDLTESSIQTGVYFYDASGNVLEHLYFDTSEIHYINVKEASGQACFQIAFEIYDGNAVLSEYIYRDLL